MSEVTVTSINDISVTVSLAQEITVINNINPVTVEVQTVGLQGPAIPSTFETVSLNIAQYPNTYTYTLDKLTSITYSLPASKQIVKTLNYTLDKLTSIVLSGDTPDNINLTKTLTYTDDNLTGIAYS